MVGNSNEARKNYSKYSLPSSIMGPHMMSVKAEKKPRLATISIIFIDEDEVGVIYLHDDALVVTLGIRPSKMSRILIDTGSSVNIIFRSTLDSMKIHDLKLGPMDTTLYGFAKSYTFPSETMQFSVTIGSQLYQKIIMVMFQVVDLKYLFQ